MQFHSIACAVLTCLQLSLPTPYPPPTVPVPPPPSLTPSPPLPPCQNLRPTIPEDCHPLIAELMRKCWDKDEAVRPEFSEVVAELETVQEEVGHHGFNNGGCCVIL